MAFEEDPPASAPEWIVTFSDMVSLLVTFFVLLLTFTATGQTRDALGKMRLAGSSGIMPRQDGTDPIEDVRDMSKLDSVDAVGASTQQHSRPDIELPQDLEHMGQKLDALHVAQDLNQIFDGLVLRFPPECSFAPGSATPTPALVKSLREMAKVLPHYPLLITIEGHTDDHFQPDDAHPDAESLSLARALAAANLLRADPAFAEIQLGLAARGAMYPRVENDSPLGRLSNRRIEIRLQKAPSLRRGGH